jgi:hypothetical protein
VADGLVAPAEGWRWTRGLVPPRLATAMKEAGMRYLLLICSDDRGQAPPPRAEMEAIVREKARAPGTRKRRPRIPARAWRSMQRRSPAKAATSGDE